MDVGDLASDDGAGSSGAVQPRPRGPVARPTALAIASALVPGLGHLLEGRRGRGLAFLVPTVAVLVIVAAWAFSAGLYGVAAALVAPGALVVVFVANIVAAGWRASAVIDAVRWTGPGRAGIVASAVIVGLLIVVPHLVAANTILATASFLDETFAGMDPSPDPGEAGIATAWPTFTEPPEALPTPVAATPTPAASVAPTPSPTPVIPPYPADGGDGTLPSFGASVPWERADPVEPWGDDGRFDLLLIGSDAGAGRWSRRNDVMLLVEVDVATGRSAMVGIPRNLINAPYPPGPARDATPCGCQDGLINEMYVEATGRHPGLWPGEGAVKGIAAIRSVVSTLTGRPIDAVLIVDLVGVIRVVDAMGGIDIDVPEAVEDWAYPDPGRGKIHIRIKAGEQHMDGRTALAYARSRHQDSDYGRMRRQQTLLLAIRQQLGPETILNAPALFAATRGTAWTDLPREALPALVELFGRTVGQEVTQLRIVPPGYPAWLTAAWVNQIRRDVAGLLPGLPAPRSIGVPRPVATTRPAPRPTAKATPKPTDSPTAMPTQPPTAQPTQPPTAQPTQPPTARPTEVPTKPPPTDAPTAAPTHPSTAQPTQPPAAP